MSKTQIVTTSESISAWRRSRSEPPKSVRTNARRGTRHRPPALDSAEDRDREALRRPSRPRRRLGRQLAQRRLELARRPRAISLVEALRELLERQATLGAVLAERDGDALPLHVGDAEI